MDNLDDLVDQILEPLADGFEVSDLWDMVHVMMEHAEDWVGLLNGADKKKFVLQVLEIVLSHDAIDLPGPDWLTKKVIMWFAPSLIDKFVDLRKSITKFG